MDLVEQMRKRRWFAGQREVGHDRVVVRDLIDFRKGHPDVALPPPESLVWRRWYRLRWPDAKVAQMNAIAERIRAGKGDRLPVFFVVEGGRVVFIDRAVDHLRTNRPHKCDARCRGAKRGDCECACGGEFHGCDALG